MPPPDNGNQKIPFAQLVAVEKVGENTYRSKALAFAPAGSKRTYGGHVYMQACYAAAQTVGKDFVLHVSQFSTASWSVAGSDHSHGQHGVVCFRHRTAPFCTHTETRLTCFAAECDRLVSYCRQSQRTIHVSYSNDPGWWHLNQRRRRDTGKRSRHLLYLHLFIQACACQKALCWWKTTLTDLMDV